MSATNDKKNKGKKSFIQLMKFVLVGASNTIIDFIVSAVLNAVFHWYYFAKVIGYCCGILNSYLLNSGWTFREERKKNAKEIISFILVNLIVLLISLGLMNLFKDTWHIDEWWLNLGLPEFIVKIIDGERACMLISTCICIIINFVGNKLFVFKNSDSKMKHD